MKMKIKMLEEKLSILNLQNRSEIVDYYENLLNRMQIENDENNSVLLNSLKNNSDNIIHTPTNINSLHSNQNSSQVNMKNLITNLIMKNQELNEELKKFKKCERFAHVYKNLVDKAGSQIQKNKK